MGQRSQIILITPKVYYNENNGNNNKGKIFSYHNQWRYGENAIIVLSDTIKKLKHFIEGLSKEDKTYFKSSLSEKLYSCILYAENHRIDWNMNKSHSGEDITKGLEEPHKNNIEFLDCNTDNNNGWFFIKVDNNLNISFCIMNGSEEGIIKECSVEEYLKLFESEKNTEIAVESTTAIEHLKEIKNIEPLKEIDKLRKNNIEMGETNETKNIN